jgi:hypothetical protein
VVYHTQSEPCTFLYHRYSDWEHGDRGRWIRWRHLSGHEHRREVGLRRPDPDAYSHVHADSDGYTDGDGYSNPHGHSNSNPNTDTYANTGDADTNAAAKANAHAKAAAHAVPSSVIGRG